MRKVILSVLMFILICTFIAFAVSFNNKEDALDEARNYKQSIDQDINNVIASAKFKTDKECIIDPITEAIECRLCYIYTYNGVVYDDCIFTPEGTTAASDNEIIKDNIEREIIIKAQQEEIKYIERELKDTKVSISK